LNSGRGGAAQALDVTANVQANSASVKRVIPAPVHKAW